MQPKRFPILTAASNPLFVVTVTGESRGERAKKKEGNYPGLKFASTFTHFHAGDTLRPRLLSSPAQIMDLSGGWYWSDVLTFFGLFTFTLFLGKLR